MRMKLCALGLTIAGCLVPPPASERATDAARALNIAARFGRMDVALELTNQAIRDTFVEHRSAWGKEVRVLDVELAGFKMPAKDHALIEVDYSWTRMSEGQLHNTRVAQDFRDAGTGFRLVRERRVSGDPGLFGEATPPAEGEPHRDVQFATKVIQ